MISRKLASKFAVMCVSNSGYPARRRNTRFQSFWFQRLMLCFSFVLQAGTSSCISVLWPSAVWVSRELILELGNLSQGLGPWLQNRALLNQGKAAYLRNWKKPYISPFQPTFELYHHFGICSIIHLRRLNKCGCTSVVKISYYRFILEESCPGWSSHNGGICTSYLYKKKSVLLKDLTEEEGCYQDF